jgi:hypothetical protein
VQTVTFTLGLNELSGHNEHCVPFTKRPAGQLMVQLSGPGEFSGLM